MGAAGEIKRHDPHADAAPACFDACRRGTCGTDVGAGLLRAGCGLCGKDIVELKVLSDRLRAEGGGIAWPARFLPPPGKLIKIVAKALSDEHVFNLEGGPATKAGAPTRASGGYTLNPTG